MKKLIVLLVIVLTVLLLITSVIACQPRTQQVENLRWLTEDEKEKAINIALSTPEAAMLLDEQNVYNAEVSWVAIRWEHSTAAELWILDYDIVAEGIPESVPESAVIYPMVYLKFGEPIEQHLMVAVDLETGKAVWVELLEPPKKLPKTVPPTDEATSLSLPTPGKIAFISDREGKPFIYVMNPDGSNPTKIGSWFGIANTFCWSPDGTKIAFIDADNWLCLVGADGKNLSRLAEIPSYSISWSPDGGKIAASGQIAAGCLDIYTVDVDTGKLKNLTNTPDMEEWWLAWSPDSDKIAFVAYNPPNCDISLMDADGNNQTTIASEYGICEELTWSPGGEEISYVWYTEGETGPEGICRDVCLVDTRDGSKVKLTDSPKYDDRDVSWSPDGTKIAFSSRRQVVNMQIYVMNADGSQLNNLTAGESSNYLPSWSPDGKRIVFTRSGPHPAGKDICIMDADGSNVTKLTITPNIDDYLALWSPQ